MATLSEVLQNQTLGEMTYRNRTLIFCGIQLAIKVPVSNDQEETMSKDLNTFDEGMKRTAGDIKSRVNELAGSVKEQAGQAGRVVSEKIGQTRESAAEGLNEVASVMHDNAESLPGGASRLTHGIANKVGSAAEYLRESDFSKMGKDATSICRRYP